MGYVLPSVVGSMPWTDKFKIDHEERTITIIHDPSADQTTYETRAIEEQLLHARSQGSFDILKGWRDEQYAVFGIDRDVRMERSGSSLLGILTVGAHLTAYQRTSTGEIMVWVARRALEKSTYAGMLDNTVAGGIAAGERPLECIVREAQEEASLPEDLTRKSAIAVGTISYFYVRDARAGGETGLLQPETQYLYDIELPEDVVPKPSDDEVHDFQLLSVDEAIAALRNAEFKPNCALCLIEFFIRHGVITAENEPDYREILARLHRRIRL